MARNGGRIGKFLARTALTGVIAGFVMILVGVVVNAINPIIGGTGIFAPLLSALITAGFFIWAVNVNPGSERFTTIIGEVISAGAIVEFLRNFLTFIPSFVVEFTWTGLAVGLGSLFLANAMTRRYIVK